MNCEKSCKMFKIRATWSTPENTDKFYYVIRKLTQILRMMAMAASYMFMCATHYVTTNK
jgi:hypothetical protein